MSLCSRLSLVVGLVLVAVGSAVAAEPSPKIRVVLTYGGHNFDQPAFFGMFEQMPDVQLTKAELPKSADLLAPGLEKNFDVVVMYDMNRGFTPAQQQKVLALLEQGIGVVALHHNLGANREWPEWRKVIGGKYVFADCEIDGRKCPKSSYSHDEELKISIADPAHPITRGLSAFTIHDETYKDYYVAPGVKVLLTTDHPKNTPQVGWLTQYGKSPVVYLMLGHDAKAYNNPSYRELVARSIRYVARAR